MSDFLFSYGTLQPNLAPVEIAHAVRRLEPFGNGFVRGVLYNFGNYPGAIPDPASNRKILGRVFRLPEDATLLPKLDAYEGIDPESPENSLYLRVLTAVQLDSGSFLPCWMYVYNRNPGNAQILESGDFSAQTAANNSVAAGECITAPATSQPPQPPSPLRAPRESA